jgi:hypothetical protein
MTTSGNHLLSATATEMSTAFSLGNGGKRRTRPCSPQRHAGAQARFRGVGVGLAFAGVAAADIPMNS